MELLLKREQTQGKIVRVQFKLWAKVELDEEERKLLDRYQFYDAVLIRRLQPLLLRISLYVAGGAAAVAFVILVLIFEAETALVLALLSGGGAGYWFYNEYRETVIVKDLLLGRYFSCFSIVDLAQKEVWVENSVAVFRQVMESAKLWDGTERHTIEALPRDEALRVILRAL